MKKMFIPFVVACPLLAIPACSALQEIMDVPVAVVEDVGGLVDGVGGVVEGVGDVIPDDAPQAAPAVAPEDIGKAAEIGTTLVTGSTALAALVGGVVTMLASVFLKKKKTA